MVTQLDRRSLLLASDQHDRRALRALLETPLFNAWEVHEADSIERARFVLQMEPHDVLVLDSALYRGDDPESVSWLAAQQRAPVLLLAEAEASVIVSALRNGARQWLARDVALKQPEILAATLQQVAQVGEIQRRARATGEALHECRRQVSRLVSLLWDAVPGDGRRSWFPQRHMLERLEEEVARSMRHRETLTVVLGEIYARQDAELSAEGSQELATWTVAQVTEGKRRCDVAGQYGPHGFMLLLPNTAGAGALQCCRRIQVRLEQPTETLPQMHADFGVVSLSAEVSTVKGLLSRAEERLERSKADRWQERQQRAGSKHSTTVRPQIVTSSRPTSS
jgi:diguanylate cyclase (GGDEF)-like protein